MNKRGELTSAEIIGIVLVIVGFAIVLAFIYGFKDSVTVDDDICKLSVISRATASQVVDGSGAVVPLKCTTKKICLTDSLFGGSCSQFTGEKDVQIIRLSGTDSEKANKIQDLMAQAMYSCWNNMGQGKLDLFSNLNGKFGVDKSKPSCVICSRVAIADKTAQDISFNKDVLSLVNVGEYLRKTQVPGSSLTYWQTFSDVDASTYPTAKEDIFKEDNKKVSSTNANKLSDEDIKKLQDSVSNLNNIITGLNNIIVDSTKSSEEKNAAKITLDETQKLLDDAQGKLSNAQENNRLSDAKILDVKANQYEIALVFSQFRTNSFKDVIDKQISWGAAAAGGSFIISPVNALKAASKLFTFTGAIVTVAVVGIDTTLVGYNTYMSQKAAAGYCGKFTSQEEAQKGCSIVQIMPYSFKDISQLCPSIQGNP